MPAIGPHRQQEAVPALAALLATRGSATTRVGLERIPDPSVDNALREALGKLQGQLLVGVMKWNWTICRRRVRCC